MTLEFDYPLILHVCDFSFLPFFTSSVVSDGSFLSSLLLDRSSPSFVLLLAPVPLRSLHPYYGHTEPLSVIKVNQFSSATTHNLLLSLMSLSFTKRFYLASIVFQSASS